MLRCGIMLGTLRCAAAHGAGRFGSAKLSACKDAVRKRSASRRFRHCLFVAVEVLFLRPIRTLLMMHVEAAIGGVEHEPNHQRI